MPALVNNDEVGAGDYDTIYQPRKWDTKQFYIYSQRLSNRGWCPDGLYISLGV